jgi:hypothetical protein
MLEGLLAGKKTPDSTGTGTSTSDEVKKTLGNILTAGTKKADSTQRDTTAAGTANKAVKDAAKSVLGGLLKKKKKDSVAVKKDSLN